MTSKLKTKLKSPEYRAGFVAAQINIGIPFQIRALVRASGLKQEEIAKKAGMLQPRISTMQKPGGAKFTLETLRRLAAAFDVALIVKFVPFGELVDWSESFNPETFSVTDFEHDIAFAEPVVVEEGVIAAAPSAVEGYLMQTISGAIHTPPTSPMTIEANRNAASEIPIFYDDQTYQEMRTFAA